VIEVPFNIVFRLSSVSIINLLFGLFVRIVVYVNFSICTNLCIKC
jgi:hypothetical protein